jgi:hypothetical protein
LAANAFGGASGAHRRQPQTPRAPVRSAGTGTADPHFRCRPFHHPGGIAPAQRKAGACGNRTWGRTRPLVYFSAQKSSFWWPVKDVCVKYTPPGGWQGFFLGRIWKRFQMARRPVPSRNGRASMIIELRPLKLSSRRLVMGLSEDIALEVLHAEVESRQVAAFDGSPRRVVARAGIAARRTRADRKRLDRPPCRPRTSPRTSLMGDTRRHSTA